MNTDCVFEPNVIDAATNDAWTQSLRAHIASCESCAAAAEVAPWMDAFSGINEREHILPDPAVLWLKARLLQSNAAVERASLPITRARSDHGPQRAGSVGPNNPMTFAPADAAR